MLKCLSNLDQQTRRAHYIYLIVFFLFIYLCHAAVQLEQVSYLFGDPSADYLSALSLVVDGDLDLSNQLDHDLSKTGGQIAIGKSGQWFSVHEPLLAIAASPFFLVFGKGGLLLMNILMVLAIILVSYECVRVYFTAKIAFIAVAIVGLSNHFIVHSYSFSHDILGTLLLVSAALCFQKSRVFLLGLLLGSVWLARLPFAPLTLVYFAVMFIDLIKNRQSAKLSKFLICISAYTFACLIFLLTNYLCFGNAFVISYNQWLPHTAKNIGEIAKHSDLFHGNMLIGFISNIFDIKSGILFTAPIYLFGIIFGLSAFYKTDSKLALIFISQFILLFLIFSLYTNGNPLYPNRYHLPIIAMSVIPIAFFINTISRKYELRKPAT